MQKKIAEVYEVESPCASFGHSPGRRLFLAASPDASLSAGPSTPGGVLVGEITEMDLTFARLPNTDSGLNESCTSLSRIPEAAQAPETPARHYHACQAVARTGSPISQRQTPTGAIVSAQGGSPQSIAAAAAPLLALRAAQSTPRARSAPPSVQRPAPAASAPSLAPVGSARFSPVARADFGGQASSTAFAPAAPPSSGQAPMPSPSSGMPAPVSPSRNFSPGRLTPRDAGASLHAPSQTPLASPLALGVSNAMPLTPRQARHAAPPVTGLGRRVSRMAGLMAAPRNSVPFSPQERGAPVPSRTQRPSSAPSGGRTPMSARATAVAVGTVGMQTPRLGGREDLGDRRPGHRR